MKREHPTEAEVREFVQFLKALSEEKQEGLYLMTKGAAALCGEKGIFE